MTEFQGAILSCQLKKNPELMGIRANGFEVLTKKLHDIPDLNLDQIPQWIIQHSHHLFMMRVPEIGKAQLRNKLVKLLEQSGLIGASSGYIPLHRNRAVQEEVLKLRQEFNRSTKDIFENCPITDTVCQDTIWLPQNYLLADEDLLTIVANTIHESLVQVLESER